MFAHVTINTADLEASLEFYTKHIGLQLAADLRAMGAPIVFLDKDGQGTKVELIHNQEQKYSGSGISIGFGVEDIEKSREYFVKNGLNPTDIIRPNPKTAFFFVEDPSGLRVQLIKE